MQSLKQVQIGEKSYTVGELAKKLNFSFLPKMKFSDRKNFPVMPGIYFVVFDGKVYYVGMSAGSLKSRWGNHQLAWFCKTFDADVHFLIVLQEESVLLDLEQAYIAKYDPVFNDGVDAATIKAVVDEAIATRKASEEAEQLLGKFADPPDYDENYKDEINPNLRFIFFPYPIGTRLDLMNRDVMLKRFRIKPSEIPRPWITFSRFTPERFKSKDEAKFFTYDEVNLILWYIWHERRGCDYEAIERYLCECL